jgi:hypothetical protein
MLYRRTHARESEVPGSSSACSLGADLPSRSFCSFLGAPIAGYILQAFGGPDKGYEAFRPAIFYSGGLSLMAAVLLLGCRLKETREWRKI